MLQKNGSVIWKTEECNHLSCQNVHYYVEPRKIDKGAKILFEERIAENFPNLGKQTDTHVHKE